MSTHKYFDRICAVVVALSMILVCVFMGMSSSGLVQASTVMGYEERLFDRTKVHSIDIVMDDWDGFLEKARNEEYELCSLVIDNEAYKNVAIRAKGNTSLSQVGSYGNNRYSFKIEFDHYDSTKTYHGLDKLSLNNIIQDNTYMKDFLTYQMMAEAGVKTPLCSYVYLTVNGEDWGLYLAIESIEEAFLERNYGKDYGELYKPDSMSMGGGRGNGKEFDMDSWDEQPPEMPNRGNKGGDMPEGMTPPEGMNFQGGMTPSEGMNFQEGMTPPEGMEVPEGMNFQEGMTPPEGMEVPEGMNFQGGMTPPEGMEMPEGMEVPEGTEMPEEMDSQEGMTPPEGMEMPDGGKSSDKKGGGPGGMQSEDVSLIYTDDSPESYKNIFDNAKTDLTDKDQERLIAALKSLNDQDNLEETVNIEEVIRYFVVHNFVCNFDSYTGAMIHNYYLYEKDGQLSMLPWDYNLAFGGFEGSRDAEGLVNYPIDTPVSSGNMDSRPMISWIFSDQEYTDLYHEYFEEFLTTCFDSGFVADLVDYTKEMIAPYVEKDPTKFCTYEEFEKGVDVLRQFCLLRAESIRGQLDGSIPSTSGGQNQDPEAKITVEDLSISDMGSMGGGFGGGPGGDFGDFGGFKGSFGGRMPNGAGPDGVSGASESESAENSDAEKEDAVSGASKNKTSETGNAEKEDAVS